MAITTICTLASLSPGTVLTTVLRFEMWALRTPGKRRIVYEPGIENGIVQDYDFNEMDRTITGQAYVNEDDGTTINSMFESSTTYWAFSDGTSLWKVYFLRDGLEKVEPWGNKTLYEVRLGVYSKLV